MGCFSEKSDSSNEKDETIPTSDKEWDTIPSGNNTTNTQKVGSKKKSISRTEQSSKSYKTKSKSSKTEATGGESKTPNCLKEEGYELRELLGEGSYSRVYRVTKQGVDYACKRYKIDKSTIKWVDRCLYREMTIAMKVRHRSIVEAYTAIKSGADAFLIIQYAGNGSVRSYVRKLSTEEYMSEYKVRSWSSDLFAAVAYLHGLEIAHRDIKTDNFLLNDEWKPLLCDFSFACISDKAETRFGCMVDTVCGTSAYLAPEVHSLKRGEKYDAKLSDVFALGVSLFEMLTKKVPYVGRFKLGDSELIKVQQKRDYQFPSKVLRNSSCEVRNLVACLLEPNPRCRISINRALQDPWFSLNISNPDASGMSKLKHSEGVERSQRRRSASSNGSGGNCTLATPSTRQFRKSAVFALTSNSQPRANKSQSIRSDQKSIKSSKSTKSNRKKKQIHKPAYPSEDPSASALSEPD